MVQLTRNELESFINDTVPDVESLVIMLELTIEDILKAFPDRVVEHREKFGLPDSTDGILEEEEDDPFGEDENEET